VIAGHSLGCLAVSHLASSHPNLIEHLILISPAGMALRPSTQNEEEEEGKTSPKRFFLSYHILKFLCIGLGGEEEDLVGL